MYSAEEIKTIIIQIAEKYGVLRIYLFRSYARGDNTEDSDVDLRIDKGKLKGMQMAALLLDLEDALGKPVDLISTTTLDEQFLNSISKEEQLLYAAG